MGRSVRTSTKTVRVRVKTRTGTKTIPVKVKTRLTTIW